MPTFDVEGARRAGYSDAEIDGAQRALAAGYTPAEIDAHLSGAQQPQTAPKTPTSILDTALGAGRGVIEGIGNIPSAVPLGAQALGDLVNKGLRATGMMTPQMEEAEKQRLSLRDQAQALQPSTFDQRFTGQGTSQPSLANSLGIPQPQSEGGQAAQTIGSFLPGAAGLKGSLGGNLAIGGAAGGGAYAGGKIDPNNPLAPVAGALTAAALASKGQEALAARSATRAMPKPAEIIDDAEQRYGAARKMANMPIPQSALDSAAEDARLAMADVVHPQNAAKAYNIVEAIRKPAIEGEAKLSDLVGARLGLKQIFRTVDPDMNKPAAATAIPILDRAIEARSPGIMAELKRADSDYSTGLTAKALDKREAKAALKASGEHSGLNYGNKLIQNVHGMLLNNKESRGLTDLERTTLEGIGKGPVFNSVRAAGNVLGGGGGLGALTAGAIGAHYAGHDEGAGAPILGLGLRLLGNRMVGNRAAQASAQIRGRSPFAQSLGIPAPAAPKTGGKAAFLRAALAALYAKQAALAPLPVKNSAQQ